MMEGVNSTMTYRNNFCKCHNIPPVQQKYDNKNKNTQYKKMPGRVAQVVEHLLARSRP
jgi:hypothetical protein